MSTGKKVVATTLAPARVNLNLPKTQGSLFVAMPVAPDVSGA